MSRLEVACALEGREYVAHAAAMLHSLIDRHPGREVRVHVLHTPRTPRRRLRALAAMLTERGAGATLTRVGDDRVSGLPTRGFTGKATWYRILLPELLPEVDRLLYLDADLLVVDDLSELWETPLGEHPLAAVTNVLEPWNAERPAQLGLAGPQRYFNAGVLLLDLARLRSEEASARLIALGRERAAELTWRDQDLLNIGLADRRLELHPRWNAMNILARREWSEPVFGAAAVTEALERPAIRHFEGPGENKPWHRRADAEGRRLYRRHRAGTPWPRVKSL